MHVIRDEYFQKGKPPPLHKYESGSNIISLYAPKLQFFGKLGYR